MNIYMNIRISFPYRQVMERGIKMKRLVCRKCRSTLFKFKQKESCIECYKCNTTMEFNKKHNEKIKYLTISWEPIMY